MEAGFTFAGPARVHGWQGGSGGGAALVFLHGFEQHPGAAPWLAALARERRVYAPEHPGFGQSPALSDLRDISDIVLHYRAYLTPIVAEHGPVDLVGHSLGGMFAAEIAIACPDLVRHLVLVNAYGLWLDDCPQPDPFVIPAAQFEAAKWADPARAAAETSSYGGPPGAYVYYRSQNLGAASKFMWPIADRGLARRLKYLTRPVSLLHGAEDGLVPVAYATAWAAALPQAELVILPGAGHLPMVEREADFLAALRRALGGEGAIHG